MADRVFVHVGAPKSGTTYLQDWIARNAEAFKARGLTFPVSQEDNHFRPALDLIQESWAGELDRARGQWDALADAVRGIRGDVLISHEILAAARPDRIKHAVDGFGDAEVHVVLTARDFARQLPAEWQEGAKHRRPISFDGFAQRIIDQPRVAPDKWFWQVQSVPDVLSRWSNGLLPEHVHVVTVPPPGSDPETLWQRFLSVFGIEDSDRFEPTAAANASIGIAEIMVLRRLNRLLKRNHVSRDTYVPMVRELIVREVFAQRDRSPAPVLPDRFWPFADEVAAEWIEWIEGAGVDVVGDLGDLRPVRPTVSGVDPDSPRPADVADAAIDALCAVLVEWDSHDTPGRTRQAVRRLRRRLP